MLPSMNVSFKEKAKKTVKVGQRGIVALVVEEEQTLDPFEVFTSKDIPENLSEENKEQIELTLLGYINPPRKIIVITVSSVEGKVNYTEAQDYLESIRVDYIAIPQIKSESTEGWATWLKEVRDEKDKKVKIVLPHTPADHEGVINFTTNDIMTKDRIYTTAEYCPRMAGLIAGTPLTIASTFAPLPEVIDVEKKKSEELDASISNGELIIYNDGDKVKVGRGVNSLQTITETKGKSFKKIKIVEAMDLINDDIKKEIEDTYIGKYANSYDNKCLLISAILEYLEELETREIVKTGSSRVELDLEKQTEYLRAEGINVEELTELEIKNADTGSRVFLKGYTKPLDAIEDVDLDISIARSDQ